MATRVCSTCGRNWCEHVTPEDVAKRHEAVSQRLHVDPISHLQYGLMSLADKLVLVFLILETKTSIGIYLPREDVHSISVGTVTHVEAAGPRLFLWVDGKRKIPCFVESIEFNV